MAVRSPDVQLSTEVIAGLAKVTLWLMPSVLVNVTVADSGTTMSAGLKRLLCSETDVVAIGLLGVVGVMGLVGVRSYPPPPPQAATATSASTRRKRII